MWSGAACSKSVEISSVVGINKVQIGIKSFYVSRAFAGLGWVRFNLYERLFCHMYHGPMESIWTPRDLEQVHTSRSQPANQLASKQARTANTLLKKKGARDDADWLAGWWAHIKSTTTWYCFYSTLGIITGPFSLSLILIDDDDDDDDGDAEAEAGFQQHSAKCVVQLWLLILSASPAKTNIIMLGGFLPSELSWELIEEPRAQIFSPASQLACPASALTIAK